MAAAIDALADLSPIELEQLRRLKDAERQRLKPEQVKARAAWIDVRAALLVKNGATPAAARQTAERAIDGGVLLPGFELDFDMIEFLGCTVGDVLADPDRFVGQTLADPNEGAGYGRSKAMIMQRPDGSLWIHSFAHGRTTYDLKYDAAGLRAVLAALPDDQVIPQFVRLTRRMADVTGLATTQIRHELQKRLKDTLDLGKLEFRAEEKAAREAEETEDARRRAEERQRQRIAAGDMRPQHPVPAENAPYRDVIPQLDSLLAAANEAAPTSEPVIRDIEGTLAVPLVRRVDNMHLLTADTANAESDAVELAPPEHVLLTKRTIIETQKLIERRVDYISGGEDAYSVRLPTVFVHAWHQEREDSPLPIITSVATMPIILPDGTLLSGHRRIDRGRRILFWVPPDLEAVLPSPRDCDPDAVAAFLINVWLIDVPCNYGDKLKLIALAMTILERSILPARPGFFITAGRRGNGKTTALMMIAIAALGELVSASAWSFVEEERRKALLAYMGAAVALIAWDNIPRGRMISCPHIDRALTSHTYTDRVLGFTENRTVPSFSVHAWTGNNCGPKGDTSSRSLISRLGATRPDPENRSFKHDDPLAWTFANRGRILRALYTVILGNPRLTGEDISPRQTRFKVWHHLIGAALEHAAIWHRDRFAEHDPVCAPEAIEFKQQFLRNDDSDEDDYALAIVLRLLRGKWGTGTFTAADIAHWIGDSYDPLALTFSKEFLPALDTAANMAPPFNNQYSPLALSFRLRCVHDAPTATSDTTVMCLRYDAGHQGGSYRIEELHP